MKRMGQEHQPDFKIRTFVNRLDAALAAISSDVAPLLKEEGLIP